MLGRVAFFGMLMLVVGCRATPGRVVCYGTAEEAPKREVVFAQYITEDTLHDLGHKPIGSVLGFATGTARFARSIRQHTLGKAIRMRIAGEPPAVRSDDSSLDPAELERELCKLTGTELLPAQVELHLEHTDALAKLEKVIDGASRRLDVIMFLWDNDEIGWLIAKQVAAKAASGVPVRVLVDGAGNMLYGLPKEDSPANLNAAVCWLAKQPNVELIRSRIPLGMLDHRKLFLADARLAWTGGRNITRDEFSVRHDLSFTVRGPVVRQYVSAFEKSWEEQGGKPCGQEPMDEPLESNATARLVTTGDGPPTFERALYRAIDSARSHIYLENTYLSDGPTIAKLADARQRGVDVRVVMTVSTGQKPFDRGNRATANRLRKAGIRVYIYPGLTHVKAASVDGLWAYIGTGNFDPHSLRINREFGLSVASGPLIREVEERVFREDFRPEWELTTPFELSCQDYLFEWLVNLIL